MLPDASHASFVPSASIRARSRARAPVRPRPQLPTNCSISPSTSSCAPSQASGRLPAARGPARPGCGRPYSAPRRGDTPPRGTARSAGTWIVGVRAGRRSRRSSAPPAPQPPGLAAAHEIGRRTTCMSLLVPRKRGRPLIHEASRHRRDPMTPASLHSHQTSSSHAPRDRIVGSPEAASGMHP